MERKKNNKKVCVGTLSDTCMGSDVLIWTLPSSVWMAMWSYLRMANTVGIVRAYQKLKDPGIMNPFKISAIF